MTQLPPSPDRFGEHPLLRVLTRRRSAARIVQALYLLAGGALGVLLPRVRWGPQMESVRLVNLLFAVAGAYISYIALVFSILFLVAQYANTTLTPRLNLFRDDPLIAHTMGLLVGVFIYAATAGLSVSLERQTSVIVPGVVMIAVLASLILTRSLQQHAYRVIQLSSALDQITVRGAAVLESFYSRPIADGVPDAGPDLPPARCTITWPTTPAVLRQLDLPALVSAAVAHDGVLVVHTRVGGELQRGRPVLSLHGGSGEVDEAALLRSIDAGAERTFAQDPQFALRLLSDISIRALSPAVNDPTTVVQGLASINHLLGLVVDRDLDVGRVADAAGDLRVVVALPDWDELVATGLADIAHYGATSPSVQARLHTLIDDLEERAPAGRTAVLAWVRNTGKEPSAGAG